MQRQIPPGRAFSCKAPVLAPILTALNVTRGPYRVFADFRPKIVPLSEPPSRRRSLVSWAVFSDTADSCTAKCRLLRGLKERRIGTGTGSTVLSDKLDLRSPKVQVLRQSMSDAHEECEKAYLRYERAFSIAAHTNPLNSSGVIALQRSGRDYAKAIARHSNAVMHWLALVDRSR